MKFEVSISKQILLGYITTIDIVNESQQYALNRINKEIIHIIIKGVINQKIGERSYSKFLKIKKKVQDQNSLSIFLR